MICYLKQGDKLAKGQKRKGERKSQIKDINAPSCMKLLYPTESYVKLDIEKYVNITLGEIKLTTSRRIFEIKT